MIISGEYIFRSKIKVTPVSIHFLYEENIRDSTYEVELLVRILEGEYQDKSFSIKIFINRTFTPRMGTHYDQYFPPITEQPNNCEGKWLFKFRALNSEKPELAKLINEIVEKYHKERARQ